MVEPECCKNCKHRLEDGDCRAQGKKCMQWRAWFAKEWAIIRVAAAKVKEARDERRRIRGEK